MPLQTIDFLDRNSPLLNPNPIALWAPLPELAGGNHLYDLIGDNHGILTNGVIWSNVGIGPVISFNGSNGYISVPDSPIFHFGAGEVSILMWVNTNTPSTTTYVWCATSTSLTGLGVLLSVNNAGTFNIRASDGTHSTVSSTSSFINGKWRQAGLVLNRSLNKLIPVVDGQLLLANANSTSTVTTTTNTNGFGIGALAGGGGSSVMNGSIANIIIFPFALSASQIYRLYLLMRNIYDPNGLFNTRLNRSSRELIYQLSAGIFGTNVPQPIFKSPLIVSV